MGILRRCSQLEWDGWGVRAWLVEQVRERVVEQGVGRCWVRMDEWMEMRLDFEHDDVECEGS